MGPKPTRRTSFTVTGNILGLLFLLQAFNNLVHFKYILIIVEKFLTSKLYFQPIASLESLNRKPDMTHGPTCLNTLLRVHGSTGRLTFWRCADWFTNLNGSGVPWSWLPHPTLRSGYISFGVENDRKPSSHPSFFCLALSWYPYRL